MVQACSVFKRLLEMRSAEGSMIKGRGMGVENCHNEHIRDFMLPYYG